MNDLLNSEVCLNGNLLPLFELSDVVNILPNPLRPDISMHILHTVHYTFHKLLPRRICIVIKGFFSW